MKKIVSGTVFCLIGLALQAQPQGSISFERKINMHRRLADEQMKAMLPEFRTSRHMLVFNDQISVYKAIKEENIPDPFENSNGGQRVMIRIGPGENGILYKNYNNKQIVEQTELADKDYIIDDTIRLQSWKLNEDNRSILGHNCKKATMKPTAGMEVTAWYAEDIPSPAGPENFGGLPGVVLGIDINNGETVFTATDIKLNAEKKELMMPTGGKHITRDAFQKKVDEMIGPAGPGGRRTFRL